ncbi:MAG: glycoside hydrolase family 92 protein [bacterium]|nr:glycoside hydrolase family 92 protein [bacterium]
MAHAQPVVRDRGLSKRSDPTLAWRTAFLVVVGLVLMLACAGDEPASRAWVDDPASFVSPFIGTEGARSHRQAANTVPGAVMPYGMLSFGPEHVYTEDLLAESDRSREWVVEKKGRLPVSAGGYNYAASRVKGFSLTRLSGTGCLGASGDVPLLPFTSEIEHSPDSDFMDAYYSSGFSHNDEQARPGYYQVRLANGVNVELSATERTGIARFTYPEDSPSRLLVRTSYSQLGSSEAVTKVNVEDGEITGSVTSGNFCGYLGEHNRRSYYTLHFVLRVDMPITGVGSWEDDAVTPNTNQAEGGTTYGEAGVPPLGRGSGVWVDLDTSENQAVTLRAGISYVSLENARLNLAQEQGADESLESISAKAYEAWNDTLKGVRIVADNHEQITTFYTALYHSQFHPNVFSDVNGEYSGFDGNTHATGEGQGAQYANFSGWDVYRSQLQLITMLDQDRASDIAQSLFNQASQYGGVWDRWTHNSGATGVMSGDPATIAIANFVAFGADRFDVEGAYRSLEKAATTPTAYDLSDEGCPVFCRGQRPSLDQWLSLNYISDQSNSWEGASETLEQSSADFALSQLAERLGQTASHRQFLERSGFWKNLFNPNATENKGYIQGRNSDGSWKGDFDSANGGLFVEGSPAQYLWMVPFDGLGLAEKLGGDEAMSARLDGFFHKPDGSWVLFRDSAEYADVSNQPSINSPWMYLFTGEAHKTQATVSETLKQLWHAGTTGIPGQDDLGQMSSWYVFSSLGLYPLYPGRSDLVLSSPSFSDAKIGNITIRTQGLSGDSNHIQSLKVNGRISSRSWIDESHVRQTVVLDFELSGEPNRSWGKLIEDRPPSFSVSRLEKAP